MIPILIEAALRSLLLALAVWAGLRVFRVRNVLAQKSAWGLVLASALLMPILAPFAARWQFLPSGATLTLPPHPMALLKSWRPAPQPVASFAPKSAIASPAIAQPERTSASVSPSFDQSESKSDPAPVTSSTAPATVVSDVYTGAPVSEASVPPVHSRNPISAAAIAWLVYLGVAGALFLRLFYGLASAFLLWYAAEPISLGDMPACAAGLPLRASRGVSSPVTIGSGVVLPADYADWDAEKLRIVLAHERSHIRQAISTCNCLLRFMRRWSGSARSAGGSSEHSPTWPKPSAIAPDWSRLPAAPLMRRSFLNSRQHRAQPL
jgi:hypothetical protein